MHPKKCNWLSPGCDFFQGKTECADPTKLETCQCPQGSMWNSTQQFCSSDENCNILQSNPKHGNVIYDPIQHACIQRINAKCNTKSSKLVCPENAECHERNPIDYVCKCKEGFVVGEDQRSCHPRIKLNEPCAEYFRCEENFACVDGVCSHCPKNIIWSDEHQVCFGPLGGNCGYQRFDFDNWGTIQCDPGNNAICGTERVCKCKPGYKEYKSTGKCFGIHGAECSQNKDCSPSLSCINGKCECSQLSKSKAAENGLCTILSGLPCTIENDEDFVPCSKHSSCVNGICTCDQGFLPTSFRQCFKGLNASCTSVDLDCNYEYGLGCIDGNCNCIDPELTYIRGRGCSGGSKSMCGRLNEAVPKYIIHCAPGLACTNAGICVKDGEVSDDNEVF